MDGEAEEISFNPTEEQLEAVRVWYEDVRLFVAMVSGTGLPLEFHRDQLWPIYSVCYTAALKVVQVTGRTADIISPCKEKK